jgi:hypothetical protein
VAESDESVPVSARKNIDVLRRFENAEESDASPVQLAIERASQFFGSPAYFVGVIVFVLLWIGRTRGACLQAGDTRTHRLSSGFKEWSA